MSEDEPAPEEPRKRKGSGAMAAAGTAARIAYSHRDKLVAALELLRERSAVSAEEEDDVVATYEAGDERTRRTIDELVERLEQVNFGQVVIGLSEGIRKQLPASAQRLMPDVQTAAGTFATTEGRLAAKDAVQDLIKKGHDSLLSLQTPENEKVLVKWAVDTVGMGEMIIVRAIVGLGALLVVVAILLGLAEFPRVSRIAHLLLLAVMAIVGLYLVKVSRNISKWADQSRGDIEQFFGLPKDERMKVLFTRQKMRPRDESGESDAAPAAGSTRPANP